MRTYRISSFASNIDSTLPINGKRFPFFMFNSALMQPLQSVSVCGSSPPSSPPSSHHQAENCTGSNCLTFYGSEIVSLSLMDNDGASPCYVKLCDNETTDQPCCSSRGSWEKADNPEGASCCCLTTGPRAPYRVTLLLGVHRGDRGVTVMCGFCLRLHIEPLIWDLDIALQYKFSHSAKWVLAI